MSDSNQQAIHPDFAELSEHWNKIAERSSRILGEFMKRQVENSNSPDPLNIGTAFMHLLGEFVSNPQKMMEVQTAFWNDYMQLWQSSMHRFFGGEAEKPMMDSSGDRRFKDQVWSESVVFDFIKQSYLLTAQHLQKAVHEAEGGLDEKEAHKVEFYTKQFIDAMSPSNFVMTNPEVLRATLETGGENLVKGLENLLEDIEVGHGQLKIRMTDTKAFEIGKNIALTPGSVVFQNNMMQLIQYNPSTEKVAKTPLLILPPWINKFYILDLQPENSLIKWAVDQGFTVFVVSWVNPTAEHKNTGFAEYIKDGVFAALDAIEKATGEKEANVVGYCIGGTLLATTLAYMKAKKDTRIKSATYFTTLIDFQEPGDLGVFIDEEQISGIEKKMEAQGYLDGQEMAGSFNLLRSNDLIWSFVINNYMMGKSPFPFDLLYWNSDSTRMPCAMHSFYLRKMYLENALIKKGGVKIGDVPIDLSTITTPSFIISTREDHIAPWKSTYVATQTYSGPMTFVLSGSGHIAGIINPPAKKKYGYWMNSEFPKNPDQWLEKAKQSEGSWWPEWSNWLMKNHSEAMVKARTPGDGKLKTIEAAPGSYVKVRS